MDFLNRYSYQMDEVFLFLHQLESTKKAFYTFSVQLSMHTPSSNRICTLYGIRNRRINTVTGLRPSQLFLFNTLISIGLTRLVISIRTFLMNYWVIDRQRLQLVSIPLESVFEIFIFLFNLGVLKHNAVLLLFSLF